MALGAPDADGRPIAALGLACRSDGAGLVRVLLRRCGNDRLLKAVAQGAPVAATFSRPTTHRSIQLKAASAAAVDVVAEDEPALARQLAALRDELVGIGYASAFATVYCSYERHDVAAIAFVPDAAFVQTPGPGAGSALP